MKVRNDQFHPARTGQRSAKTPGSNKPIVTIVLLPEILLNGWKSLIDPVCLEVMRKVQQFGMSKFHFI